MLRAYRLLGGNIQISREIQEIVRQGSRKDYPLRTLKKWIAEAKEISNRPEDEGKVKKTFRRVITTNLDAKLRSILEPKNVYVVSKKSNTLYGTLRTTKNTKEKTDTLGVYKVPLEREGQNTAYIGRTQKSIKERLNQHKDNIRNGNCATSLSNGVIHEGWHPIWSDVEVLARPRTLLRSMVSEYIHIRNNRQTIINEVEYSDSLEAWRKATGHFM